MGSWLSLILASLEHELIWMSMNFFFFINEVSLQSPCGLCVSKQLFLSVSGCLF